ncbi:MAG: hypothetical protein M3256_25385 [Actinomycetota bacterium]|nr:hypothetical protein [Actinomycetota bacterium]
MPPKITTAEDLRKMFAEMGLAEMLTEERLREQVYVNNPAPLAAGQVSGTRSQLVRLIDPSGTVVAEVHRYLQPDGKVGASGLLDPKYVLKNGVGYMTP